MSNLPIESVLADLGKQLQTYPQVILHAPPGAGKSTYLPYFLIKQGQVQGKILLLEPRRLAAKNIANYLAEQFKEPLGQTIGLRMRGETRVSENTRCEVITEGVLTQLLQADPFLTDVGLVIFDEFHERHLQSDLALALTLEVQQSLREDLRLLIMSATLDAQQLSQLLPTAALLSAEGRSYPVSVTYAPVPARMLWQTHVKQQILNLLSQESGSILVFLPGESEIKTLESSLIEAVDPQTLVLPLYGNLPLTAQQHAIQPTAPPFRKVVLATNIAETSLTIEGIRVVVDLGLARVAKFDRKSGVTRLETQRIAKDAAIQRMGRAGRLTEGVCLRLYSEDSFQRAPAHAAPEILQTDLTDALFELKRWGCDADALTWLDAPHHSDLIVAEQRLIGLGILDHKSKNLTPLGQQVASLSVSPRLGALLCFAKNLDEVARSEACWLAAWLELPPRKSISTDVHSQIQSAIQQDRAFHQRAKNYAKKMHWTLLNGFEGQWLGLLASCAFPDRIAQSRSGTERYLLANGHGAKFAQDADFIASDYLVVCDLMRFQDQDSLIFCASPLNLDQIEHHLPHLFEIHDVCQWDDGKGKLNAHRERRLGAIVLAREPIFDLSPELKQSALMKLIRKRGFSFLPLCAQSQQLMNRAQCAANWDLIQDAPLMTKDALLQNLENWLLPFMPDTWDQQALDRVNFIQALEAYYGWSQMQQLDALLPERFQVPTGSIYPIDYQPDQLPTLSVKMQEMYGQACSPCIAQGKIILRLVLLSPAQRPLQITQDLAGFWQGAYQDVKKEMRGRYPKHVWPDAPESHVPTRLTKRHLQSNSDQ